MNSLNIGDVKPDRKTAPARHQLAKCPRCGSGPDKRIDGGGFGPKRQTLCGYCGHEFTEA